MVSTSLTTDDVRDQNPMDPCYLISRRGSGSADMECALRKVLEGHVHAPTLTRHVVSIYSRTRLLKRRLMTTVASLGVSKDRVGDSAAEVGRPKQPKLDNMTLK